MLGPLKPNVSAIVEPRLRNFPDKFRQGARRARISSARERALTSCVLVSLLFSFSSGLFRVGHQYMPRLDLAIHLRAQFYHFEGVNRNASDPLYREEVGGWLAGTEARGIFEALQVRRALLPHYPGPLEALSELLGC